METPDFAIIIFSDIAFIFTQMDLKFYYVNTIALFIGNTTFAIFMLKISNRCKRRKII